MWKTWRATIRALDEVGIGWREFQNGKRAVYHATMEEAWNRLIVKELRGCRGGKECGGGWTDSDFA
jgi:hypothetical protein